MTNGRRNYSGRRGSGFASILPSNLRCRKQLRVHVSNYVYMSKQSFRKINNLLYALLCILTLCIQLLHSLSFQAAPVLPAYKYRELKLLSINHGINRHSIDWIATMLHNIDYITQWCNNRIKIYQDMMFLPRTPGLVYWFNTRK